MSDDKYCLFHCRGELLAVPALAVRSVTPLPELSPVPLSHRCLAGLANVHKEIVPVFDLCGLPGFADESDLPGTSPGATDRPGESSVPRSASQQMLAMNSESGGWGVLIGQVMGLETLEVSFKGRTSSEAGRNAITAGSASCDGQFVTVVDPDALLALLNESLQSHWELLDDRRDKPPVHTL
jgi:chemotaxis signal transduction protein